jgi:hypothetical protein
MIKVQIVKTKILSNNILINMKSKPKICKLINNLRIKIKKVRILYGKQKKKIRIYNYKNKQFLIIFRLNLKY